jgi:hypothetical protein
MSMTRRYPLIPEGMEYCPDCAAACEYRPYQPVREYLRYERSYGGRVDHPVYPRVRYRIGMPEPMPLPILNIATYNVLTVDSEYLYMDAQGVIRRGSASP